MKQKSITDDQKTLLVALRNGDAVAERSKENWGEDEREKLIKMHGEGEGISKMALELQRGENAVVQQLIAMDMLMSPCNRRSCGKRKHKCNCPKCLELQCPYYDRKRGKCRV